MKCLRIDQALQQHHLTVPRTARYHTLGDAAKARAIWIVLHGYGQLARYFLRKFEGLEDGLLIAAPEGLSRFYTDEAHSRVGATWMTREDRENEIHDQCTYLDALATELLRTSGDVHLNVLGFSQGVATACRWAARGTTSLHGLVLWGGTLPTDLAPEALAQRLDSCRVQLVYGTRDSLVPPDAMAPGQASLCAAGVPFTAMEHPGGHELDRQLLDRLLHT